MLHVWDNLEENAKDNAKRKQGSSECVGWGGGWGVKTGIRRKRLRKCDIGKAKGKKFFTLRALQVI